MEKQKHSLLETLLHDSSFRNWAKKTNKNDQEYWNHWISNNQAHIDTVHSAKAIILGITFKKEKIDEPLLNAKLKGVLDKIRLSETQERPTWRERYGQKLKMGTAIAATILLIMAIGFTDFNFSGVVVHKAGYGEILELTLPDGTSVVLNGNSKIQYNKNNHRDVTLDGEAYFKVKSIPSTHAKFWVNTEDLRVEVYGTQFLINTREHKTEVALDEGSIQLLLKNGISKKMKPGEMVTFSSQNDHIVHEKVSKEIPYSLWRDGTFVFNNVSLKEVMKHLEYTYGIPAKFMDNSLDSIMLTGGIPNQNLKICISALEKSTETKIILKDDMLYIYENN